MKSADDLDLAGIGGGFLFVLSAKAGGEGQPPFITGFVGVVPNEFGIESDGAVGAWIGAGVQFDLCQAVTDELECGGHDFQGSEKAKVRLLRPAGRTLK